LRRVRIDLIIWPFLPIMSPAVVGATVMEIIWMPFSSVEVISTDSSFGKIDLTINSVVSRMLDIIIQSLELQMGSPLLEQELFLF